MKPTELHNSEAIKTEKSAEIEDVPFEELLGSVTKFNTVDGSDTKSQQLRTSARVFKKMKLDSAISAATVVNTPEKEAVPVKEEPPKLNIKKHAWPQWAPEDKNLFFEGLNEHGKDFEAILSYIVSKNKRKGLPDSGIRSKDQIRQVYYRTWHKISKHLKFSPDVKKVAQELYGLVNYGELRKRMSSVNEKTCMKLNELIYTGTVAIRSKGKTVRIKTPMCRALRRLNQLNDNHYDLKLPTRVTVELRPKDTHCWMRVQEMSQNPRIRTTLPLQRRLGCLFTYLKERWKPLSADAYEKIVASANEVTAECLPDEKKIGEIKVKLDPIVRLRPLPGAKIETPVVNLSEYFSCQSICLNAYEERVGVKVPGEQLWQSVPWSYARYTGKGHSRRQGTKRPRTDSTGEKSSAAAKQTENAHSTATDKNENHLADDDLPPTVQEVIDQAVNTLLALNSLENGVVDVGKEAKVEEKPNNGPELKKEEVHEEIKCEGKVYEVNTIREGWTAENCGVFAIGELYLMFGSDSKLILEYSWDNLEPIPFVKLQIPDEDVVDNGDSTAKETETELSEEKVESATLNTALRRLLSVAKLHYRKNIIKCPCGHVCGGASKSNNSTFKFRNVHPRVQQNAGLNRLMGAGAMVQERPTMVSSYMPTYSPLRTLSPSFNSRPTPESVNALKAQLESIQRLRPKFCARRGRRPRAKQVVVERKLPLLANKGDPAHQILQMNIISQDKLEIIPPKLAPTATQTEIVETAPVQPDVVVENPVMMQVDEVPIAETYEPMPSESGLHTPKRLDICDNAVMSASRACSPTGISNFLEMALAHQNQKSMMLGSTGDESKESSAGINFVGLLTENMPSSTPPASPSRLLKENENQWINAEVADFSLSSFLGHLESPMKVGATGDDSRMSQDVDAQLQSLLTESSVDYTAKFADLAAQVVLDAKK